jgi:hypothetical protein
MISFVLVTRNDNYEGSPMERLKTSLHHNLKNLKKYFNINFNEFEILIGDWGSDTPITKKMLDIEEYSNTKIIYFNKNLTSQFDTPFNEVHSLNYLIRNSKNNYVARLDQDIIIGEKFFEYVKQTELSETKLYWSTRRDLFETFDNEDYSQNKLNFDPNSSLFYKAAVGIIVANKNLWSEIKGYNENHIQRNHMEHDLYSRFINKIGIDNLINLGTLLDVPFYHIYHKRIDGNNRKINDENNSSFFNNENWGLEEHKNNIVIHE